MQNNYIPNIDISSLVSSDFSDNDYQNVAKEAPIFRIRNKFRMRLLIKYDVKLSPQEFLMKWINKNKIEANIKLEVDVDPINFL